MKKILSLYLFIFILIPTLQSSECTKSTNLSAEHKEQLEELITEVRSETEKIDFCLQQLLQALQAKKIDLTISQTKFLSEELIKIQDITTSLLNNVFIQVTSDTQQECSIGLILNNIIAKYLLQAIKTDIMSIRAAQLNSLIEKHLQKEQTISFPQLIDRNQKIIEDLIQNTDFIGLTWYNRSYRFLKTHSAGSYVNATAVGIFTLFAAGCIYQSYVDSKQLEANRFLPTPIKNILNNVIGKPGKIIGYDHVTGRSIRDNEGNGALSIIVPAFETAKNWGIIQTAPLITLTFKDYFTSLYYSYWLHIKNGAEKRWNQFDTILSGSEKKYEIGDCERVFFKDMTGAEHLEDLAKKITNYLMHPERYERAQIEEHRGILLHGPPQTGKTLFAKALYTMVNDNFGSNKKIHFIDAKKILDRDPRATIDEIFDYAKYLAPCILFFDEIDLLGAQREKNTFTTGQLLTNMQGVDMVSKQIIVIGATNRLEELDKALIVDGRFGKIIHIDYPNYFQRKSFLEQQLNKRNIHLDPAFVDNIAQETEGASYNKLKRLITESLIASTNDLRSVTPSDFEKTLDSEIRKIAKPNALMSQEEKRIIATYQAGKALMRHLLQTKREVVKITTLPVSKEIKTSEFGWSIKTDSTKKASDNEKFVDSTKEQKMKDGEVFTKTTTNNNALLSNAELKKECFISLAGAMAHQAVLNDSFIQCNPQDRAEAMKIIYTMISNGEPIDKHLREKAIEIKESYEKEIEKILSDNKNILEKIVQQLMEKTTINRYEWKELMKGYPTI